MACLEKDERLVLVSGSEGGGDWMEELRASY
jgi:hypothetical protein